MGIFYIIVLLSRPVGGVFKIFMGTLIGIYCPALSKKYIVVVVSTTIWICYIGWDDIIFSKLSSDIL